MNWLDKLNESLKYIEDNLDNEIDLNKISQIACCSSFHYQRMFSYIAGVTLSEYIRRRRMTKACFDLQNGHEKIIDISLKYGYDSPTAFNRAFKSVHGVAPSAVKKQGVALKAYNPINFKITIRGEEEMNYKIIEKESFRIIGVKLEANWSSENQEGFVEVPKFWQTHREKGTIPELCKLMNTDLLGVMGISVGDWQQDGKFDYYIAVASTAPVPEGMYEYQVPASTWAVFECRGAMPSAIQKMQERIMGEWFPNSGYKYANAPDIEVYTDGDQTSEDYISYVWLPIAK